MQRRLLPVLPLFIAQSPGAQSPRLPSAGPAAHTSLRCDQTHSWQSQTLQGAGAGGRQTEEVQEKVQVDGWQEQERMLLPECTATRAGLRHWTVHATQAAGMLCAMPPAHLAWRGLRWRA